MTNPRALPWRPKPSRTAGSGDRRARRPRRCAGRRREHPLSSVLPALSAGAAAVRRAPQWTPGAIRSAESRHPRRLVGRRRQLARGRAGRRRRHHPQWTQLLRCHGHHSGGSGRRGPGHAGRAARRTRRRPTTWCPAGPGRVLEPRRANGSGPDGRPCPGAGRRRHRQAPVVRHARRCVRRPLGTGSPTFDPASIWASVGPRPSNSRPLGRSRRHPRRARRPRTARLVSCWPVSTGDEDQVAGPRQRRVVAPAGPGLKSATEQERWQPRGTVLITGGTGALGSQVPSGSPPTAPSTWSCQSAGSRRPRWRRA